MKINLKTRDDIPFYHYITMGYIRFTTRETLPFDRQVWGLERAIIKECKKADIRRRINKSFSIGGHFVGGLYRSPYWVINANMARFKHLIARLIRND